MLKKLSFSHTLVGGALFVSGLVLAGCSGDSSSGEPAGAGGGESEAGLDADVTHDAQAEDVAHGGTGGTAGTGGSAGDGGSSAGAGGSVGGSGGTAGTGGAGGTGGVPDSCGDGVRNPPDEECDGLDLGSATCASVTFDPQAAGEPTCLGSCKLSTSGCTWCGDGVMNNAETCDGADHGSATCASALGIGSATGSLSCSNCSLSTTGCVYCGDGVKNGGEQCDGASTGGATCSSVLGSGYAGSLGCDGSCTFNTAGCYPVCTPNCAGKECGANGCGGTCGTCQGTSTCQSGQCVPACTPTCSGAECGLDGCGGLCGACTGNEVCSSAKQCTLCTDACEALVDTTLPYNTSGCTPTSSDCAICGAPSCGLRYSYTCGGAPVGSEYAPPDIAGCKRRADSPNSFCCPTAACVRYQGADAYCQSAHGLPVGRACHIEAAAPAGCVPSGSYANVVCCPS